MPRNRCKIFLLFAVLFVCGLSAQQKPKIKTFTSKNLNAYEFDENKYDFRSKDSFNYLKIPGDTISYFLDPSEYKGILNYGVDYALRDKRAFNFIEDYFIFYNDIVFEKCTFSVSDSIAEIEGHVEGGWNTVDFKGGPPPDFVEAAVGKLKEGTFVVSLNADHYDQNQLIITYKGEEKKESFPLDTLKTLIYDRLDFKKTFYSSNSFKIRVKIDKNSVLSISKLSCFSHFYNIGEMCFSNQKKKTKPIAKKDKDAPRFQKIIENNLQVNNPKNNIKKEIPLYYQLTEKAETYIVSRQFAKAKETYRLLANSYPTLYARDIHNAIRCAILSRDFKTAFLWGEKLAAKGIELSYFNAKIFNAMQKNPQWKTFSVQYDSICKSAKGKWNLSLKNQMNDLLKEDQNDYGLENRKEPPKLYETTVRVTDKFLKLLKKEGYPSEEKIGAFTRNDTILVQSPEFQVVIRHAVQQKPKGLDELNELLNQHFRDLEFDLKRGNTHKGFTGACFHIYKGNLYINKSCDYNSQAMVKRMVFMFNNPNRFIIDNGDYIVSEYNKESPQEWDKYYETNFNLVVKLTDDWEFYEK